MGFHPCSLQHLSLLIEGATPVIASAADAVMTCDG